jgi:hypothetical protein
MSAKPRDKDLRAELRRYSKDSYVAEQFADALCSCGGHSFRLKLDDTEGAAIRTCVACSNEHPMGDSADYIADAELEECACPCGGEVFEITAGVALYKGSEDVRWLYIGCRCVECHLAAVYGDWKNEFGNFRMFLEKI